MADERRRSGDPFFDLVEALRTDVREDIGHLRDDVREDIQATEGRMTQMFTDFVRVHNDDHGAWRHENDTAHTRFSDFIRAAEIAQARRDGSLGVFRYALELVSRHAKPIALVIGTLATSAALLAGSIRIEVIAR